ncbi:uncharacterized protein LOC122856878 isoform X2 [Aphidius gifuensis]|nr:uncharacterized protein LOC122856878 isoform X2 [Aphidius gifuensis]
MSFLNIYSHCVSLLITGFILYIAGFDLEATSCHARLSTIGTVLLMSEALMVLTPDNVWSQSIPNYRTRSHLHWMLQLTGTIMNITGAIIMIKDKKDDTISLHAILGLLSIASMIFLCLSGTTLFYTVKLKKIIRPVVFKFIHT